MLCLSSGFFVAKGIWCHGHLVTLWIYPSAWLCNTLELFLSLAGPGLSGCSPEKGLLPEKPISGTLGDLYQPEGGEQPHPPTPWRVYRRAIYLWAKQGSRLCPAGLHREAVGHRVSTYTASTSVTLHWLVGACWWSFQRRYYSLLCKSSWATIELPRERNSRHDSKLAEKRGRSKCCIFCCDFLHVLQHKKVPEMSMGQSFLRL